MAGEEGVPYRADTGGSGATSPDLRAPLGEPYIIKPEDWIALAKAGDQNAAFTNAFKGASSLVDNVFTQRLEREKAQAGLALSAANTGHIEAETANLNEAADVAKQLKPLQIQQESQKVQQGKFTVANMQRAADLTDKAWGEYGDWSAGVAKLDPNSATYDDDLYALNKQYPNASTNPDTMRTIKPLIDQQTGLRNLSSAHALSLAQNKELQVYQDNGLIPSNVDLRTEVNNGNGQTLIAQAKRDASLQRLKTVENIGTPQEQLWARNQINDITGANRGPNEAPPPMFSPNGDLNVGTELNLQRAEANVKARFGVVSPYANMTKSVQRTTTTAAGKGQPGTTTTETITGAPVTPGEETTVAQPPAQPTPSPKPGATPAPNPVAQQDAATAAQIANDPVYQGLRSDITSGKLQVPQGTNPDDFLKQQYLDRKNTLGQPVPGRTPAAGTQGAPLPSGTPGAQPAVTPLPAGNAPIAPVPRGRRGKTGQVQETSEDQLASYTPIPGGGANTGMETLQPDFADKYNAWAADMRSAGYNPRIVQAGRSPDYQQQLYDDYRSGRSTNVAAEPHASFHSYGRAFDWVNVGPNGELQWNNDAAYKAGQQIAQQHGLRGLGEKDNDHLEDASFASYRDLPQNEYGRVAARGGGTQAAGTRLAAATAEPGTEQPVNYTTGQQDTPAIPQQIAARTQAQGAVAPVIIPANAHTADPSSFTFGPATTFGLQYDGGIDRRDNGQGFYHQPNGQSYNTRDPKLVAASVPTRAMVEMFGPSAANPNSAISRAISRGDIQVQVADLNGHIMQMPIADQGPSPDAVSRATLDLTHAASRAFQTNGNATLGYRLVNRYGQPIQRPTMVATAA